MNIPEKYKSDIETATNLLKAEGCKSIFLFGSIVTGKSHEKSDLDFGISGLPPDKFFRVYSKLYKKLEKPFDLVDFDSQNEFYNLLNKLGEVVKIG